MKSIKFRKGNFNDRHPVALFTFYMAIIGFTMFTESPICRGISCIFSLVSLDVIKGTKGLLKNIKWSMPLAVLTMIINPLFNHRGRTILGHFPNGNALTLEAIIYGLAAGVLVITIMAWFGCFNESMDSDKILYLFGKLSPNLSLVLCMSLRFIPEFTQKASEISNTAVALEGGRTGNFQKNRKVKECLDTEITNYCQESGSKKRVGILEKIKLGLYVLSALISWALEHSIKKAKSMKNREYGKAVRTNYSCYRWLISDALMLIATIICLGVCVVFSVGGYLKFWYYPVFYGELFTMQAIITYIFLIILGILPLIFDREAAITNIKD